MERYKAVQSNKIKVVSSVYSRSSRGSPLLGRDGAIYLSYGILSYGVVWLSTSPLSTVTVVMTLHITSRYLHNHGTSAIAHYHMSQLILARYRTISRPVGK